MLRWNGATCSSGKALYCAAGAVNEAGHLQQRCSVSSCLFAVAEAKAKAEARAIAEAKAKAQGKSRSRSKGKKLIPREKLVPPGFDPSLCALLDHFNLVQRFEAKLRSLPEAPGSSSRSGGFSSGQMCRASAVFPPSLRVSHAACSMPQTGSK